LKHNYILFFLVFSIQLAFCQQKINITDIPSWVTHQDYELNPDVNTNEISQGTMVLLADYQVNIPIQEEYHRIVKKITDNVGIQSASDLNVTFDPLYQKLTVHSINILRDGTIIDKLNPDSFQVIRRELNAENYLYDGSLSAMTNLSDIRNGDVIDFSYSVKGFNPIHKGKYSNTYYMNDYVPIGKINVSINSKKPLNYKTINTDITPKTKTLNGLTNYQWTVINPDKFEYEEFIPQWKISHPTIVVSDHKNWKDVVNWGTKLYKQNTGLNSDLIAKIKSINNESKNQGEKIKSVLNFVQNDIRYLGLEYGIGSYKPNSPNKVFTQRYGDCKDKSLLMVSMLNKMGVEAYPMLINTTLRGTITELLPSPEFFDHCVVKVIDEAKNELYYDPTSNNQGGTYKNVHFPNYEYGLVLKENNAVFDTIVSYSNNKITTWEEYEIEPKNKGANLKVTTIYTDVEADRVRNSFKNNSISSISNEYEKFYALYYPKVKILGQPAITDNIEKNEVTTVESYKIDSIWKPMTNKPNYIAIDFVPTSLTNILQLANLENRKNEIQLPYPLSRQHNIKIKLPEPWNIKSDNAIVSCDVFYFEMESKYNRSKNEILIKNYLKIQKPVIKPEEFRDYINAINDLETSFGYSIFVPKNTSRVSSLVNSSKSILNSSVLMFIALIIIGLIILGIWISNKQKKNSIDS